MHLELGNAPKNSVRELFHLVDSCPEVLHHLQVLLHTDPLNLESETQEKRVFFSFTIFGPGPFPVVVLYNVFLNNFGKDCLMLIPEAIDLVYKLFVDRLEVLLRL
jgi:hypothetical protein